MTNLTKSALKSEVHKNVRTLLDGTTKVGDEEVPMIATDSATGIISVRDEAYEAALKENELDIDTVRRVQATNGSFVTSLNSAVIDQSITAFKENEELKNTSASVNMGYDVHNITVSRDGDITSTTRVVLPEDDSEFKAVREKAAKLLNGLKK